MKKQRWESSWESQDQENNPRVWMNESGKRIHFRKLEVSWLSCNKSEYFNNVSSHSEVGNWWNMTNITTALVKSSADESILMQFNSETRCSESSVTCSLNQLYFSLKFLKLRKKNKNKDRCSFTYSPTHTCTQLQSSPQSVEKYVPGLWTLWISLVYLLCIFSSFFVWVLFQNNDGYKN